MKLKASEVAENLKTIVNSVDDVRSKVECERRKIDEKYGSELKEMESRMTNVFTVIENLYEKKAKLLARQKIDEDSIKGIQYEFAEALVEGMLVTFYFYIEDGLPRTKYFTIPWSELVEEKDEINWS